MLRFSSRFRRRIGVEIARWYPPGKTRGCEKEKKKGKEKERWKKETKEGNRRERKRRRKERIEERRDRKKKRKKERNAHKKLSCFPWQPTSITPLLITYDYRL